MATPFPSSRSASGSTRLFPYALAATFVTIGLPFASVILVNHVMGFEGVPPLTLAIVSIACAVLASAIGAALWMQHPASNEVSFGELMIWSWARSAQARRQLVRSFQRLTDESEVTSPHDRLATLREMSSALDRKDPYTYGHSRRVERLAYRTGLALELSLRELQDLREAASVHDVGKIYVSDGVLRKEGPLTDEEYKEIKAHAVMGSEMVAFLGRPEMTEAVRFHHERWDGNGYPDGLADESIPLLARIVGTVDAYDAMTSMRSYRASLGHKRAVEILVEEKGRQFDPEVVTAFLSTLRNPLLAAITVPLLSGPIEAIRRLLGWVGRSARTDLATAAGAVGLTVAITGSIAGVVGDPPRGAHGDVATKAKVMAERVQAEDGENIAGRSASGRDGDRRDEKKGDASEKNDGKKEQEKGRGPVNERGRDGNPSGSGTSDPGSESGEAATAAGTHAADDASDAIGAAAEAEDHQGFDPAAVPDPQPARGKDCAGGGPASIGGELHCGS